MKRICFAWAKLKSSHQGVLLLWIRKGGKMKNIFAFILVQRLINSTLGFGNLTYSYRR